MTTTRNMTSTFQDFKFQPTVCVCGHVHFTHVYWTKKSWLGTVQLIWWWSIMFYFNYIDHCRFVKFGNINNVKFYFLFSGCRPINERLGRVAVVDSELSMQIPALYTETSTWIRPSHAYTGRRCSCHLCNKLMVKPGLDYISVWGHNDTVMHSLWQFCQV